MGIATALIGILPSFASIGWWAPVLLVTLRAIQACRRRRMGRAALLSVESAPKNKKAFYSSGVQVGYGVGLLLSTGLVSLLASHDRRAVPELGLAYSVYLQHCAGRGGPVDP